MNRVPEPRPLLEVAGDLSRIFVIDSSVGAVVVTIVLLIADIWR